MTRVLYNMYMHLDIYAIISANCYLYCYVHWFCFWVKGYPLSVWLLNPSIYLLFPPSVIAIGGLQSYILLCDLNRWCSKLSLQAL